MYVFLFLTLAFIAVGAVFAVREDRRAPRESKPDDTPRLVISRRVPSVSDAFKRGKR